MLNGLEAGPLDGNMPHAWPGLPGWNAAGTLDLCLSAIHNAPDARIFTAVFEEEARRTAARSGPVTRERPLAGLPVAIKDLYDIEGKITLAGSRALADDPPAARDAGCVTRLKSAGAVVIGKTAMTEFAYSGLGLNPHYGTPVNWFDPTRIPGGSSAGAGIAVRAGMCLASMGSDTNGSVRIPAAFAGVVGFRPSSDRVPRSGMVPLSPSQDSAGTLAATVGRCAAVDAAITGCEGTLSPRPAAQLVLGLPSGFLLENLDHSVAIAFEACLDRLRVAGVQIRPVAMPSLEIAREIGAGGIAGPEAYAWHRDRLAAKGHLYDPRVKARIERAASVDANELAARLEMRRVARRSFQVESDDNYVALNALILRNASIFSILDAPSISIPLPLVEGLPSGAMLSSPYRTDRQLLDVAGTVERLVSIGAFKD